MYWGLVALSTYWANLRCLAVIERSEGKPLWFQPTEAPKINFNLGVDVVLKLMLSLNSYHSHSAVTAIVLPRSSGKETKIYKGEMLKAVNRTFKTGEGFQTHCQKSERRTVRILEIVQETALKHQINALFGHGPISVESTSRVSPDVGSPSPHLTICR